MFHSSPVFARGFQYRRRWVRLSYVRDLKAASEAFLLS